MMCRNKNLSLIVFPMLLLANAAVGHAAGTLTVSPSGNGKYIVQGTGLTGVAATEVAIQYDKTALKNPRVEQGGLVAGALMVTNTNEPGKVRIATVSAYPQTNSGTGTIATITFDIIGTSAANLTLTNDSKILDVKGSLIDVDVVPFTAVSSSGDTTVYEPTPSGGPTVTVGSAAPATGGGSGSPVWLGGVSMPVEGATVEAKVRGEASAAAPVPEKLQEKIGDKPGKENEPPTGGVAQPTPSAENKSTRDKSVLEQFRLFQGEKTPDKLIALLTGLTAGTGQKPPVAVSDGKTNVQVSVESPSAGKTAPNFALKGAKLVSLKKTGDSTWIVEVLPDKGTFDAAVNVLQDGAIRQIPLTVVPPLPTEMKIGSGGKLTGSDFNQFLKERGTDKAPRFDLNGDGKRDYIDDYIFTANYLMKRDAGKKP